MSKLTAAQKSALSAIGKVGGSAGKGEAKRRPPEHYRRISKLRWGRK